MKSTGGAVSVRSGSSSSRTDVRAVALELLGLLALGALAVAWHVLVRGRLRLGPGHQGLAWMALVMIGRLTSRMPWAAVATASGAAGATLLPFWRLGDPFLWVSYMAAGAIVDLGFAGFLRSRQVIWAIALLGGVAHATKPLIRSVIQMGGWHYDSLIAGVPYPASTHFVFGAAGAFLGASLIRAHEWNKTRGTISSEA